MARAGGRYAFPRTMQRGPLAGQHFTSEQAYVTARAQAFGFTSYSEQRRYTASPAFKVIRQSALNRGESSRQANASGKRLLQGLGPIGRQREGANVGTPLGQKMGAVIARLFDEGYFDSIEDVDEAFY